MKHIGAAIGLSIFILVCIAFILPLIAAFSPLFFSAEQHVHSAYKSLWKITGFTLKQALFSTMVALLIGFPAAFFTARRKFFGKNFLLALSAVPLCIPVLLVALGFVMFLGMQGTVNKFLMSVLALKEPPVTFLYSFLGIVVAQGFYNFPIVMKTCHDAWTSLSATQHEAAVMLGASRTRVFRTITLIQLLPAITTSAMLVFLFCFFSFVIVLLFGGIGTTVLEVEIYQAARTSLDFSRAAKLALTETGIAVLIICTYTIIEKSGRKNSGMAFASAKLKQKKLSKAETFCAVLFWALVVMFFIAPFANIIVSAFTKTTTGYLAKKDMGLPFTLGNFSKVFSRRSFWKAFVNTITTGLASAFLCVCCALFYSCLSVDKKHKTLKVLPLLPMTVSSVVLGLGIMLLVPKGTPFILVLCQSATFWPLAYRQIYSAMVRIPQSQMDAAKCLSPSKLDPTFNIQIPMCRKNILAAFGFCFAMSIGDTTLPLMLAIPNFDTMALYTYKLAGSYRFNEACACGVVLGLLATPIFLSGSKNANGEQNDSALP